MQGRGQNLARSCWRRRGRGGAGGGGGDPEREDGGGAGGGRGRQRRGGGRGRRLRSGTEAERGPRGSSPPDGLPRGVSCPFARNAVHRGLLAQRDLEYRAQVGPDGPGGRRVRGAGPRCASGSLHARAGRPPGSFLEPEAVARRGRRLVPRRPGFSTPQFQAPRPFLEWSVVQVSLSVPDGWAMIG